MSTIAEELKSQTKVYKGTKVELQGIFDAWVDICDDKNKKNESSVFERHEATWDPTARKTEAIAEKAWQLSQSNNTKGQQVAQDWNIHLMAKENGWSKDKEGTNKICTEKK